MSRFHTTTTYSSGGPPFTWSYSKLKNYRNCPKKHYHTDLAPRDERIQEKRSQQLDDGEMIHTAMEKRCRDGVPLPPALRDYEAEAQKALAVTPAGTITLVEEKAAIREDFTACGYFDQGVWLRMKVDFAKILPSHGLASLRDWKTGRIQEDSEQLALTAQWVFSKWPDVQLVTTRYIWLGQNAETRCDFKRSDMVTLWNGLWPELEQYKEAVRTNTFPPKPGGLCREHCPVTSCPYHGKGNR
jgi:hypothetical protein